MKYMGSKAKIAKYILPIILKNKTEEQYYVEPFCGGCNMIDKVKGNRIASDKNTYLIEMLKSLTDGIQFITEIPKSIYDETRTEFNNKTNLKYTVAEIGWIGFMASYNGRFFDGGYSGTVGNRDYIKEQIKNTLLQLPNLIGITFQYGSYDEIEIPMNSIIYCDIPYRNTKQYATSKGFDYDKFWQWCRDKSKTNTVFISEYTAPDDFKCIWEKQVTNSMNTNITYKPTEKLFTCNDVLSFNTNNSFF